VSQFTSCRQSNEANGSEKCAVCLIPETGPATITCPTQTRIVGTLDSQRIVSELKAERNRLDKAIAALDGEISTRAALTSSEPSSNGSRRKRHHLTPAGRKRLSMLMKKRWAEKRKKTSSGHKQNAKAT
jgi:hypothetical protein